MKIVIDPGHGGADRSNRGPTGYIEADGVLDIGLRLRDLLEAEGYIVKMTRETDKTVSLYERSRIANQWQGDVFLSLHTNAASIASANGIETFHSYNGVDGDQYREEAKRIAEILQRSLVEETGLRGRGVKTRLVTRTSSSLYGSDYYAVIRRTKMPTLITEMGFHSNLKEEALLKTSEFRQKLAEALFKGIKESYPLPKEESNEPDVEDFKKEQLKVRVEGKEEIIEGYLLKGRFYVPIRFLEVFGYNISYNEAERAVIINKK